MDDRPGPGDAETPAPLLDSWRKLYAIVLGTLFGLIVFFWILSRLYA